MRAVLKWIQETKGSIGAIVFALTVLAGLVGASKVPAKLDAHMAQNDATNRKLDVLICLQAHLATPIACVARGTR